LTPFFEEQTGNEHANAKSPTSPELKCDFGKTPVTAIFRHMNGITKHACNKQKDKLGNHPKWNKLK
jgi:hypothetical protein